MKIKIQDVVFFLESLKQNNQKNKTIFEPNDHRKNVKR